MTATVGWDNTHPHVLRITYTEPMVMQDVFDALDQTVSVLDALDHPVPLLVDLTAIKGIPPSAMASYVTIARHRGITHRNIAISCVVQNNPKVQALLSVFRRLFAQFHVVTATDEAYSIIEQGQRPN